MPVKIVAPANVGKVIANDAQFLADCIKNHKNHPAIQPLLAHASGIPNFDINTFEPTGILGWLDLKMYFGNLQNIANAVQQLNLYPPTSPRALNLANEAKAQEANIQAAAQIAQAPKVNLRHHGGISVTAPRVDANDLLKIDNDKIRAQNDWNSPFRRLVRYNDNRDTYQRVLEAYDAAERQIEQRLFNDHEEGRQFHVRLDEDKQKVDRLTEIEKNKIQRGLAKKNPDAMIKQLEADVRQKIDNKIILAKAGTPVPHPRLLYYAAPRSKKYGSTVPNLTTEHVFRQGIPALELAAELVDPNSGHIDKDAINIPEARRPLVYIKQDQYQQKRLEQIQRKGALLGATAAVEENLKREDTREGLYRTLEAVLRAEGKRAEAKVRDQLLQKVPGAVVDQLLQIHDNAIKADKGFRGAFVTLQDYIRIAGREGGTLRLMVSNAIIDAVKAAKPGIADQDAQAIAEQLINPCLRGIRETPPIREHHVHLEARKGDGAPLRMIDTVETTSDDGSRYIREMNKWVAGTSPSAVIRGWTLADTVKEKWEILNEYLSEQRIPPEFAEVPPEHAKALERVSPKDKWLSNQALNHGFIQGMIDEEKAFRENPMKTVWSWMYRVPFHAIAPAPVQKAVKWLEDRLPPGPGQLSPIIQKKLVAPLYMPDRFLIGYAEGQARYALSFFSPLLYSTEKGDLAPAPLAWLNNGWNMAMDGLGRVGLTWNTRRTNFLGEEAAGKSFLMNFWKCSAGRAADRRKSRNPIALLLGITIGAAVIAVAETILNKIGLAPVLRTALKNIEGLNEAFRYGAGWADPDVIDRIRDETKVKLPDWFYKGLNRGGKIAAGLSKAFSLGKVTLSAGVRGLALGLILSFVGVNTPLAIGAGIGYGAWSFAKGFLEAPVFGGEWDKITQRYIGGALADPNSFWSKLGLGKFAEYYNTPLDEILLTSEGSFLKRLVRTTGISIPRIFPVEGLLMSLGLIQLGIPLPWALAPFGIHLGINVLKEVSKLRFMTHVARGWSFATGGVSLYADLAYAAHTLAQKGGIFGLFFGENGIFGGGGLSWQNIEGLIQMPLVHLGFMAFFKAVAALFFGATGMAVGIPALIATVAFYGSDQVLRWFTGMGHWELWVRPSLEWIWDKIKGWLGKSANFATGTIFKVLGIIGLIRALLSGDTEQIAISVALFLVGLGLTVSSQSPVVLQGAVYTPAVEGEGTVAPVPPPPEEVPDNTYIKNAEKEAIDMDGNTLIYEYHFDVNRGSNPEISLTEQDIFQGIPANAIASVSMDGASPTLSNGNRTITVTETTSASRISRTFRVTLNQPLNTYLQGNAQLCNTLTITTSPAADQNVIQNECINAQGDPVIPPSGATHLPMDPSSGRITQCYKPADRGRHPGIDIVANTGVPIYAVWAGTVEKAGWAHSGENWYNASGGLGRMVLIKHDNNLWTVYGHLSSLAVQQGDRVEAGQLIGNNGSTGNSSGSHLHFGIYPNLSQYTSGVNPCDVEGLRELNICTVYGGIDCT